MKMVLTLIFVFAGSTGHAQFEPNQCPSRCNGQFISCHDNQTGKVHNQIGADTCVKCFNDSNGERFLYAYCAKDGGQIGDPGNRWNCRRL